MVKAIGAVITAIKPCYKAGEPVHLQVGISSAGAVKVTLSQREVEVAATTMDIAASQLIDVVLALPANVDGVLIATVWDEQGKPLAERLVFRQPEQSINIDVIFDEKSYTPGSTAKLTVRTTDADGKPIAAVVGLTVTDDSVLELIEKREQAPRLPVMVLLENDIRELADAHVYLDPHNPKAPLAVDLLLGTQGWRRFAFVETTKFLAANGDPARRVLALKLASQREWSMLRGRFALRAIDGFGFDKKDFNKNERLGGAPARPQGAAEPADKPQKVAAPQANPIPKDAAAPPAEKPVVAAAAKEAKLVAGARPAQPAAKRELQKALDRANFKRDRQFGADRKSTRLNSSHVVISYAVFCLKKKKERNPPPPPAAHRVC